MCQFGGGYWNIEEIKLKQKEKKPNSSEKSVEETHTLISHQEKTT